MMKLNVLSVIMMCTLLVSSWAGAREIFTDDSLMFLLADSAERQSSGVIYTWSPRMNLSIPGAVELEQFAREMKLDLTILLDPAVSENEILVYKDVSVLQNSYWLSSKLLYQWGITQHYPALVIYKNGKVLGRLRPGYDDPARLKDYLIRRLQ